MTEITSEIKTIPHSQQKVFDALSDMSKLEMVRDKMAHEKVKKVSFEKDSFSFSFNPIGDVQFSIVERQAPSAIKFVANPSPIDVSLWVHLSEIKPEETQMKLTVDAELNPFLKAMVMKPLQEGVNKMAEMLASVPYDDI